MSGTRSLPASNATGSGLAGRYATALFELAAERHALDQVERDLATLEQALDASADLGRLLRSPVIGRDDQGRAMASVAERIGLGELTSNFLGVLAAQRRLGALPGVAAAFKQLLAVHRGEETAEVISAVPLDAEELESVKGAVARYAGRPVQLSASVDPALLGGVVVRVGSRMIDASLKTKLQNLELSMRGVR